MRWLAGLSGKPRLWLVLVSAVGLLIVIVGAGHQQATVQAAPVAFNVGLTMRQIMPQLNVTGKG